MGFGVSSYAFENGFHLNSTSFFFCFLLFINLGAPIELLCGSDYWVCLTLEITPSIIVSCKSINGVVKLLKIYVHCNS